MRRREAYLRSHRKTLTLPKRARDSFSSLISRWLDSRRDALRPRTIESYSDTARLYIEPSIGQIALGKLTSDDVATAMARGKSPRTKNYIRTVCHLALEYALERELVLRNVAHKTPTVTVPETEREMPSQEQWEALLSSIDAEGPCPRALLLVVVFSGLREGEACGLRWPDYADGHIRVRRAADRDGKLVPVKTSAGRRTVPVGKKTASALEAWRLEQAVLKDKHRGRWREASTPDLMFTTRYGTPWSQRNVLRAAYRVTELAGMGRRSVHYLRHVAISHLVADPTLDMKTIQTIAGHSSIRVTMDTYGHLVPGRLQKVAESMDRRSGD